ncbi:S8 family peptidase [Leucobacter viscericola]|uniref:S8 family peptidase n=1 Tax=Leucobacter viscericola TaxID=2714935 RepID=A0A6G7XJ29_9MICO|nr:S8/S53 family peptidase [Leucobacter viscericola]QIK64378.1 S8 family peptidase [Leucobacter viscericola]
MLSSKEKAKVSALRLEWNLLAKIVVAVCAIAILVQPAVALGVEQDEGSTEFNEVQGLNEQGVPFREANAGFRSAIEPTIWNKSNVSVLLGGEVDGGYIDRDGKKWDGSGQVVIDIDGAFMTGNPVFFDRAGNSKFAGDACFGTIDPTDGSDPNHWANLKNLCQTGSQFDLPYLYESAHISVQPGSAAPSLDCLLPLEGGGSEPCHASHGAGTAGAIIGQAATRSEGSHKDLGIMDEAVVSSVGAAPGAQVFGIKVGGGMGPERWGWSVPSLINALEWVDRMLGAGGGTRLNEHRLGGKVVAITMAISGSGTFSQETCGNSSLGKRINEVAGRLKKKGVAVVMSSGNEGLPVLRHLDCGENIITVGATTTIVPHQRATYSNFHPSTVLYAPVGGKAKNGTCTALDGARDAILLAYKDKGFQYWCGTSFAAPQVAGAFAVLRQKFGDEPTVDELTALLAKTGAPLVGQDAPPAARDINVKAALNGTP